jgi:hypothetical protein
MTQDQYGQARGAGYGDVVEEDEYPADQSKPMTRFQKVASALRGDRPDRDEADEDQLAADDQAGQEVTDPGVTASSGTAVDPGTAAGSDMATDPEMAAGTDTAARSDVAPESDVRPASQGSSPWATGARQDDYWEAPDGREDQVAAVTSPDGGNALPEDTVTGHTVAGDTVAGDTVTGDTVAGDTVTGDTVAGDTVAGDTVTGDTVAGDQAGAATVWDVPVMPQDAAVTEAPGGAGRHAAAPEELHPGEAAGTLDDLGDLAYGKLIPDAADFTAQWQQIQFRFVDDPQASVTEAAEVVAQVTAKLEAAIQERQRAIEARQQAIQERQRSLRGRWGEGTQADTETLRETLRMYRAFLDQLIGPKG